MKEKEKWYQSTWFTILMLLFVFPVGLFLMWKFKKNWKLWVKILITVLVAISVVNMMTNKTPTDNNTSKTKTEQKSDKQEVKKNDKKPETKSSNKMNEVVKVGKMEFNVTNKAIVDQVGDVMTNNAKGKFIVLDITVKNNGDKAVDITDSFFKLLSDKKTFETDGSATITANQAVSPDDLGFIGDKINPESTKNAKLVFDVAPSIAEKDNLVLQVQSGFWGTETAKIELK
ncbi:MULTISPECIES: DUF4352 domain-containing protein [Staphylococcus]|nr:MULTISPECIES: DUF4352 domain-containing protein [Staphylococcus]MBO0386022.1 DUF4352 domain-containing protein [Staphylococcus simulans]MBU6943301.1 DUF4352 domain-containing protein [Staphylococcus sp. CWZ226]